MVKKITKLSAALTIGAVLFFSFKTKKQTDLSVYSTAGLDLSYIAPNFTVIEEDTTPVFTTLHLGKSYVGFKEALAFKESGGDYGVVNQFGYMGKYQFSKGTLALVGVKTNRDQFLNDPELQEKAFYANLSRNKWILRRELKRYTGTYINGVLVTESGVLAAAHLAGPGAVKNYIRTGGVEGFADAFGTTIRYYMERFAGYDTSFVVSERRAKVL